MEHPSVIRGKPNVPGGSALPWGRLIDGSVLTAALSDPAPVSTKALVLDSAANGIMDVDQCTVVRLMFGGTSADENLTVNFQVILWNEAVSSDNVAGSWVPRVVAKGTFIVGSKAYAVAGLGAITNLYADTIIENVKLCRVYSPADDTQAILEVPILGAQRLEVQTDLGTAAGADVFVQRGEPNVDAVGYDGIVEPFYQIINGTTATVALGDPAPLATVAEVVATAAVARGTRRIKGQSMARIWFGGSTTANQYLNYQILLWLRCTAADGGFMYLPVLIAAGVATLGADVYTATGVGAGTEKIADTITETMVRGAHVYSPADDTRAMLTVPLLGAEFITIEVDRVDAVTTDAFIQLGDKAMMSSAANLGNVGLVNAAEVEIDPSEAQAANTAYVAADKLTPLGGVKSATRHTAAELETFADDDWVPVGVTALHELRVRDDDLMTGMGAVAAAADVDGVIHGQLRYIGENIDQVMISIDEVSATASWAASTDASGITQETDHVPEYGIVNSLSFDKAAGTVTEASYGKTVTSVDGSVLPGTANVTFFTKHADYTNVGAVFVRLGTDSSNYAEFSIDPAEFTAAVWEHVNLALHAGVTTGTGLNLAAITYVAIGVTMDAAANTIADVLFNSIALHSVSETELSVSGDTTSNAVRVTSVGNNQGGNWPKDAGNASGATPRVVIATDDINLAAMALDLAELTSAPVAKGLVKVVQAVATPGTAEALVGSQTYARALYLQAKRVDGNNAGRVYVGLSDVDKTTAQLFDLGPNDPAELVMPAGTKIDLNTIYVDAVTATDGVVGWYIPV